MMNLLKYSIVIPIYKNKDNIVQLFEVLNLLNNKFSHELEVVFVVDGSPDNSYELIEQYSKVCTFFTQIILHSRNFGSFPAIRTGLIHARGKYMAVMAADLQEPPELSIKFFEMLSTDECDVAIGQRTNRSDPFISKLNSKLFWKIYRNLVNKDIPDGGVDIFGCNQKFRDQLVKLEESRSSLIALIFWLGFRRSFVDYERQERLAGKSAWTFRKKVDYMLDSIFAFTDYPIRLLMYLGGIGMSLAGILSIIALFSKLAGLVEVPGYTTIILLTLFFGSLNFFGLGLVGTYSWRAYENTKQRPLSLVSLHFIDGDEKETIDNK